MYPNPSANKRNTHFTFKALCGQSGGQNELHAVCLMYTALSVRGHLESEQCHFLPGAPPSSLICFTVAEVERTLRAQ